MDLVKVLIAQPGNITTWIWRGRFRTGRWPSMTPDTWAEKFESFEWINSIRETNGNFDSCNSCKRLVTRRLHQLHESKFPFVSRIEFIRSKLSNFSAHHHHHHHQTVYCTKTQTKWQFMEELVHKHTCAWLSVPTLEKEEINKRTIIWEHYRRRRAGHRVTRSSLSFRRNPQSPPVPPDAPHPPDVSTGFSDRNDPYLIWMSENFGPPPDRRCCLAVYHGGGCLIVCVEDIGQSRDLMLVICCEKGCFSGFYTMGMQGCNVVHSLYRGHRRRLGNSFFVFCKDVSLKWTFHSLIACVKCSLFSTLVCSILVALWIPDSPWCMF